MKLFIFFSLIIFCFKTFAFDLMPLYQSAVDSKKTSLIKKEMNSEYSSDYITFSPSIENHLLFENEQKILDLGFGSLTSKEFLMNQRLKLTEDLSEKVQFQFQWWQQDSLEQESTNYLWTLKYKLSSDWHGGPIGNTYGNKDELDIGAQIEWQASHQSQWKVVLLKTDFQKNKRTRGDDKWTTEPLLLALQNNWKTDSMEGYFFFKIEPQLTSKNTVTNEKLSLEKETMGVTLSRGPSRFQSQSSFKKEKNNQKRTDFLILQNRLEYDFTWRDQSWTSGLGYFSRHFRERPRSKETHDILPYIWWYQGVWSHGYELTAHFESNAQDKIEHRYNARWNKKFKNNGSIAVYFTFDIDRLGTDETWEGGGAHWVSVF